MINMDKTTRKKMFNDVFAPKAGEKVLFLASVLCDERDIKRLSTT
jgi:hypothetical protein